MTKQLTITLSENTYRYLQIAAHQRGISIDHLIETSLSRNGIFSTATTQTSGHDQWPIDFFEQTAGSFQHEPLQRSSQGQFEQRYELS